jgi:hypothetical protein
MEERRTVFGDNGVEGGYQFVGLEPARLQRLAREMLEGASMLLQQDCTSPCITVSNGVTNISIWREEGRTIVEEETMP